MSDITAMIVRDIEADAAIKVNGLAVELTKHGVFARKKTIVLSGTVKDARTKDKVEHIANHHAGDMYSIENRIEVKETVGA